MSRTIILICLTMFCAQSWADWDPELEAREQAEREAAQRVEQQKHQETEKMLNQAKAKAHKELMDSKRKTLGAAAKGKSDAEIDQLYDAKTAETNATAQRAVQEGRAALSQGQGAKALKQVTGKTLQELENMSDEEAEALSKQLEQKYGQ